MRISATMSAIASVAFAIASIPASAQYRHSGMRPMPPMMDQSQILAQGTAVQVPLVAIADSKQVVAKASVQDKDGHAVGSVNNVVTDETGRPSAVKINLGGVLGIGKKVISLNAQAFLFEQDRNLLIAPLTQDEIKALPASGT